MGLKGQSHRGANGRDSGRQTEKKGDETRQRRQWECMFHSRNKRLYELTTIFEERARARTRVNGVVLREDTGPVMSRFFPVLFKVKSFRKNAASFPFSYRLRPFRTMLHQLTRCNLSDLYVSSIRIWHKRIFFWLHHEWNNISPFHKCF